MEIKFVFEGHGLGFHLCVAKEKLECVHFGNVFLVTQVVLKSLIDFGRLNDNFGFSLVNSAYVQ